ncbi:hypothetical protein C8Q70DRAFT_543129 [Cubamyces menziesii]|nr:hypothetical protein C8Q70DRAFT_543129 [Cubamyces menziesii]
MDGLALVVLNLVSFGSSNCQSSRSGEDTSLSASLLGKANDIKPTELCRTSSRLQVAVVAQWQICKLTVKLSFPLYSLLALRETHPGSALHSATQQHNI